MRTSKHVCSCEWFRYLSILTCCTIALASSTFYDGSNVIKSFYYILYFKAIKGLGPLWKAIAICICCEISYPETSILRFLNGFNGINFNPNFFLSWFNSHEVFGPTDFSKLNGYRGHWHIFYHADAHSSKFSPNRPTNVSLHYLILHYYKFLSELSRICFVFY